MTAKGKRAAAKPPVTRATSTPYVAPAPAPVTPLTPTSGEVVDGKKKKKKKGKGKDVAGLEFYEDEEDDEELLPPLEPMNGSLLHHHLHGQTRNASRTGLSPELESVHLSTTASLSAATRHLDSGPYPNLDFLASADQILARRMENDPDGGMSEEYWAGLPDQLRTFVRNTYSQLNSPGNEDEKTQAMYAFAQQIHQGVGFNLNAAATATTNAKGTTTTRYSSTTTTTTATFPSLPFDSSLFNDPAFTIAVEKAANSLHPGMDPRNLSPTNVMLLNDYGSEDHDYGDYSEEEGDDAPVHGRTAPYGNYKETIETIVYDDVGLDSPTKGKKNKKKKRKAGGGVGGGTPQSVPDSPAVPGVTGKAKGVNRSVPVSTGAVPPAAPTSVSAPNLTGGVPPGSGRMPQQRQTQTPNPLPSSRAAGKQPMSYTTPAPTNPPPSRRAASKAPITSHAYSHNHAHHHPSPPSSNASVPHKPRPPANGTPQNAPTKNSKIWSTSSTEERERIKEFWLGLSEEDRRSLVKIEKEAVLKKMKEQQKHSCTCAVCGRKRNAIEEELEVLYDAYYEELEQYANHQQRYISSGGAIPPPQGPGPFPGSVELDKNGAVISPHTTTTTNANTHPRTKGAVNGRKAVKHHHQETQQQQLQQQLQQQQTQQHLQGESEFDEDDGDDDEYEEEEEYEDEEEEEDEEDEEDDGEPEDEDDMKAPPDARGPRRRNAGANGKAANRGDGLVNFGNLTVTGAGNILTVADDLLKNDGQKFLEMMEQLAERRLIREEEAAASVEEDSEEEDEEDVEEEEEDEEDDDDDDDDEEVMTEEQKMEEGKRMFSIFAARMFEQRVLQAYREKVAQERQLQLLRELEDEDKLSKEKEAKKQNANQKKKDKKRQQKAAKEEERAAKAAEKAAEEAAAKARQAAQEEENRKKREEDRQRREAQRKVQEEERQRKDEERRKRQAEEKEREAERERKRKEKEEKARAERKEREEKERKAREEREAKAAAEKAAAAAARREREEREREEREKRLAKEREEKEKAEKERLEKEKAEKAEKEKEARERALQQQQQQAQQQQQQQRSAPKVARPPTSPRNPSTSGPSQRSQVNTPTKKTARPPSSPAVMQVRSQPPSRPMVVTGSQPSPIASSVSQQVPTQVQGYPIIPGLSPRVSTFRGGFPSYGHPSPLPVPALSPSVLPRGFGVPVAPVDPQHTQVMPHQPPPPIAPPSKAVQNPLASPTQLAPGSRRSSAPAQDPGPITRPVPAPIARPAGDSTGSGSTSPSRRSPSPKGVLGSSALLSDEDEVVFANSRRTVNAIGSSWGSTASPRSAVTNERVPWGQAVGVHPPPGLSPRPPPWNNAAPGTDWHSPSAAYFGAAYGVHNPSPPPPHNGS